MRKIKEVLRLKFEHRQSVRQIAKSCDIGSSTVQEYLHRAEKAGLTWPLPGRWMMPLLENRLFPPHDPCSPQKNARCPSLEYLHRESKKKGVTLPLLWYEYKQANPEGYQYSQFCELYRQWLKKLDVCLRQEYRAGEKLFVDYAGQTIPVHDPVNRRDPASSISLWPPWAPATTPMPKPPLTQDLPSWIQSHVHAFEFFGGVTEILVPDNLSSGVSHACRYEPDINPTYQDLAEHYGTVVIPARVAKPKDKAKVESAVLVAERWILAALRNHTFFSLADLNQAIWDKLQDLNTRPFQKLQGTRQSLFETLDRPALKPLPPSPYEFAEWIKARVNIDYHIEIDRHFYSVPYQLTKEQVDVRLTKYTVEVLFKNRRVASHPRSRSPGRFYHPQRPYAQSPSKIPGMDPLTDHPLGRPDRPQHRKTHHPYPGQQTPSRSRVSAPALGILSLGKQYSPKRLEAAATRALSIHGYFYKTVDPS